jgi:hypothetical protein
MKVAAIVLSAPVAPDRFATRWLAPAIALAVLTGRWLCPLGVAAALFGPPAGLSVVR